MIVEYCCGFPIAFIFYGLLSRQWEGYYKRPCLKFFHWMALAFISTIIPHGDFLLHLGYRQKGFQQRTLEEPFPDGFEFTKEKYEYQGYLPSKTLGGFNTFFALGYYRCALSLIRTCLVLSFFYDNTFFIDQRAVSLIPMVLYAYISFNFAMLLKCLFENTGILSLIDCGDCFDRCQQKRRAYKRAYREENNYEII